MGYLKKITLLAVVVFLIAFFLVPVMSWLRSSPIETPTQLPGEIRIGIVLCR